jgi:hypothetical protein
VTAPPAAVPAVVGRVASRGDIPLSNSFSTFHIHPTCTAPPSTLKAVIPSLSRDPCRQFVFRVSTLPHGFPVTSSIFPGTYAVI